MRAAHQIMGLAVIAVALLAAAAGAYSYRLGNRPGRLVSHVLALGQTALIAQVAVGLLLLSDDRRAPDELHYLYGFLALGAVLTPWLYAPSEPRRRLLWFAGATLLAALLAIRAYMTAG